MNVLLTTLNSKYIHSSLSIRYLRSYCQDVLPNIDLEEYTINQNVDFITGEIFKKKPDVVAFSCYIWNIDETLQIAEGLKTVKKDIKIILGGPEVSFNSKEMLEKFSFIDFIIYGEGEETFKDLLLELKNKDYNFNDIDGLVYRFGDQIIGTKPRMAIENLDDIPSPFDGDLSEFRNKIVYFESSRGCPFNCNFCLSSTINGVRFFSIERVKSDLKRLIDAEVRQVKFVDRTFNANKIYAFDIMNFIMEQNVENINFHFEVTAHLLDDEMLDFLKKVPKGLFQFEIGVQSTNEKTIKAIDRTTDFKKLSEVVKRIKDYSNIHQHLDLIAGLPYEDYQSFRNSFNDVYDLKPDKLQLGFLKLLKGSKLRDKKGEHGFKFINKAPYEVLETSYISYQEILRLKIIEDLVEKYGNETDFIHSIGYTINNYYSSPFDFFEDFSLYWEQKEYHKRNHSKKDLYKIFFEFYREKIGDNLRVFNEVLKYDFIYNNKNPNLPKFIYSYDKEEIRSIRHDFLGNEKNVEKYLSDYKDTKVKKIIKEIHFEKFNFNIIKFINNDYNLKEMEKRETLIMFNYNAKNTLDNINKCKTSDVTIDFFKE